MHRRMSCAAAVLGLIAAGCGDSTGPADRENIAVRFAVSGTAAAAAGQPLVVTGSNGTLRIDRIWLIVEELELEGSDGACPSLNDDDCEFESGPFLLKLPLTGSAVTIATDDVPTGTYTELEIEIDNLDFDDGDSATEQARINALFTSIRAQVADWPRNASMLVSGTFTPTGGASQAFRTFFDAEIEIDVDLVPPLVKTAGSGGQLVVDVNPTRWFSRADGTVWNLAQWDFTATGKLLDFELDIERGFERGRVTMRN